MPDIILGLQHDQYHDGSHFGIHSLMDFANRGPGFFYHRHVARTTKQKERRAFSMGKAAHDLVLEGEKAYTQRVAIRPDTYPKEAQLKKAEIESMNITDDSPLPEGWRREKHTRGFKVIKVEQVPWSGNAAYCKQWELDARDRGREPISEEDDLCIRAMDHALRNNQDTMDYLKRGTDNVVIRDEEGGLPIQCQVDWLHCAGNACDPMTWDPATDALCDLKTCDNLNDFQRDMFRYRYDRQAAFYQALVFAATGIQLPFVFLAVEKASPHRCGVYEFTADALDRAYGLNAALVDDVAEHYRANTWPAGNPQGKQMVDLPDYLKERA